MNLIQLATLALCFIISGCSKPDEPPTASAAEAKTVEAILLTDSNTTAEYQSFLTEMDAAFVLIEKGVLQSSKDKSLDDHAECLFQYTAADFSHLKTAVILLLKLETAMAGQNDKTAKTVLSAGLGTLSKTAALSFGSMGFAAKNSKFNQTHREGNAMAWKAIARLMLAAKSREASLGIDPKDNVDFFQHAADNYTKLLSLKP